MSPLVEAAITGTSSSQSVVMLSRRFDQAVYDELMVWIDRTMEMNAGRGPDPIQQPDIVAQLRRAATVAALYEKRVFGPDFKIA